MSEAEREPYDYEDNDCWNCGGEGFVSNCFEEYACIDPEGGCDLCMKRCDVCSPPKKSKDTDALREVLAEALKDYSQ